MKTETWTTQKGTKIELTWEVFHNDINVWTKIEVLVGDKKYTSDGQIEKGALVVKQVGISANLLVVPSEILEAIKSEKETAKTAIAENVAEYKEYVNRMHELGIQ